MSGLIGNSPVISDVQVTDATGQVVKERVGVVPSAFLNITMNAVADSYPKSLDTLWTVTPPASSSSAMIRCRCGSLPKVGPFS